MTPVVTVISACQARSSGSDSQLGASSAGMRALTPTSPRSLTFAPYLGSKILVAHAIIPHIVVFTIIASAIIRPSSNLGASHGSCTDPADAGPSAHRHVGDRHHPHRRVVHGPPSHGHQGPRPVRCIRRGRHHRRESAGLLGRGDHRRGVGEQRRSRTGRAPAIARLLRRRALPHHHLPLDQGRRGGRRRLQAHRRAHHQGRDPAGDPRPRVPRHRRLALRRHPRRIQRQHRDQPQGLGSQLEHGARSRRRRGRREGQAQHRRRDDSPEERRATNSAIPRCVHGRVVVRLPDIDAVVARSLAA